MSVQNSPLYIRTFGQESEDLGFHYVAHVSLDIIEEKLQTASVSSSKDDMYLGFLGPIEDYRVYGYVTNTSVKFVVVMQDAPVRESELRAVSRALTPLASRAAAERLTALVLTACVCVFLVCVVSCQWRQWTMAALGGGASAVRERHVEPFCSVGRTSDVADVRQARVQSCRPTQHKQLETESMPSFSS